MGKMSRNFVLAILALCVAIPMVWASGISSTSNYNPGAVAITGGTINNVTISPLSVTVGGGQLYPLTHSAVTATTSSTAIDFTGIPSWSKRVTIMLNGVSTSGTSNPMIQLGTTSSIEATGYLGAAFRSTVFAAHSNGFLFMGATTGADIMHGTLVLTLLDTTTATWSFTANGGLSSATQMFTAGGTKSLASTLTRIRLTTTGGADTFDAGSINIMYE